MPIVTRKPTSQAPAVEPKLPQVQPSNYKSVVYDDKNIPLTSLLAYVTGAPWTVTYYAQLLGEHNDLREVDPGQSGTYQQYTKTIGMEIRVETPLSTSYDQDTGITTVTGSSVVYPFLTPNNADYFVAEAADSQLAIFRITQVDRKTFNRDSVYNITYDLVGLVQNQTAIFDDLEAKSVRTFHFSKDRLLEGLSPTLRTEDYTRVINLKVLYHDLVHYYFNAFYMQEYGTIVIPGQEYAYYDPFVVNFLRQIVASDDAPEIRMMKVITTDKEKYISQPQLWELMLYKDYNGLRYSNNVMGLVNKELFSRNTYAQGLAFSNIRYVVYPDTPDTSLVIGETTNVKIMSMQTLIQTEGSKGVVYDPATTFTKDSKTHPIIHEVLVDDKYVLSDNFYSATPNASVLEILVKDYLKGNTLDLDMLYAVTDKFREWKRLEQFYYGPLLMVLVKEADRAQYS